jgi:hypothetical protein
VIPCMSRHPCMFAAAVSAGSHIPQPTSGMAYSYGSLAYAVHVRTGTKPRTHTGTMIKYGL